MTDERPLLLRGGTVITMDPSLGVLPRGDVLVREGTIEAVAPGIEVAPGTRVIDADGTIVLPGLIDAYRHGWQTVLRGVGVEWTLTDHFAWMFGAFGPHVRPEDVYAGNLAAAVEHLDAGVTTLADWSDASRTPEHAEAAIDALRDSGIRARYVYADAFASPQTYVPTAYVKELHQRLGSGTGRLTMQVAIDPTLADGFPERRAWAFAHEHGIPVYSHAGQYGWGDDVYLKQLKKYGFLGPTNTYVHVVAVTGDEVRAIADSGGTAVMATLGNLCQGQGYPAITPLRELGVPVALGTDSDARLRPDLFAAMRAALAADRGREHTLAHRAGHINPVNRLRSRDVLDAATLAGARAVGHASAIGTVAPGRRADLVVLRPDTESAVPYDVDPIAHVVWQGAPERVDTVIVDGDVVKRNGVLAGVGLAEARELARRTRDHLISKVGEEAFRAAATRPAADPEQRPRRSFPPAPKPDDP